MTFKVKSGIRVNTVDVIDQYGNFTGNAFLGSTPVAVNKGGTGAITAANARINLFGDITPDGLLVKTSSGVFSTSIVAGQGILVTDGDGVGGSPTVAIDANANVTFNNVTVTGTLFSNDITASHITADGDLFVTGNLTILGETTTLNTQDVLVEDNEIILNANVEGTPLLDAFITVNRGDDPAANIKWNETEDRWQFTNNGSDYFNIPTPDEYDNVIYTLSAETAAIGNAANVRLTGTKSGNVVEQDEITFVGSGLVTISRTDPNTIEINAGGSVTTEITGVNDGSANVIDFFSTTAYRSAEYFYTVTATAGGTKFATGKIIVLHDGTTTYNNQYGMLQSDEFDEVAIFTTDINDGNVRLLAQATTGIEATIKLSGTTKTTI
jgi:hypothetical protein